MAKYKFYCKVCSDGRLYNGGMTLADIIPDPLPPNTLVLDSVPDGICDGSDYIWDGKALHYSPAPRPQTDTEDAAE